MFPKKCFSKIRKGSLSFGSINLLMEMFVNYLESKDMASFGEMSNCSMKVTYCRMLIDIRFA
jgi:hypothetical protein